MKQSLIIVFCTCCIIANAQSANTGFLSASGRNSIGVNLYPVIANLANTDTVMPFEIMYKRRLKKDWNGALRIGVSGYYKEERIFIDDDYSIKIQGYPERAITKTWKSIGFSTGYEWHYLMASRWCFFYGADIGYLYEQYDCEHIFAWVFEDYYFDVESAIKNHTFVILPFVGANLAITSRLSVSTTVQLKFEQSKRRSTEFNYITRFDGTTQHQYCGGKIPMFFHGEKMGHSPVHQYLLNV